MKRPYLSIALPIHDMENKDFFLERCLSSIREQSFQDFEIVITSEGRMAENTNAAIKRCSGELIKILYMDDYLAHKDALKRIVEAFTGQWLVTGCEHDDGVVRGRPHYPKYNDRIHEGYNTIGSPSVLTIRNGLEMFFDEKMTWMLDCDFYRRLHDAYGEPDILNDLNVVIGIGSHQTTNIISDRVKKLEEKYIKQKHA